MGYEEIGIKSISEIMKDEYLQLLAKYTGIDENKLFQYASENPVRNIFEHPESLDLSPKQLEKLLELRKWRQLFESVRELEGKTCISSPEDVYHLCSDLMYENQEHFALILLSTKNEVIKKSTISIGSLNSAVVHPREVFKEAIKYSAASVILVHNHPSGNPTPSKVDIDITARLVNAGELLGIKVLDHIIVGKSDFKSLKQSGQIEELLLHRNNEEMNFGR